METDLRTQIGSYLTFIIDTEEFAASVEEVSNILELQEITKIPNSPDYLKGIINLRGEVLPVIDTRIKFNLSPTEFTDNTCIIVMNLKKNQEVIQIGALVERVVAVREIDKNNISDTPDIGDSFKAEFITGIITDNERFILLLDLVKLFTTKELKKLKSQINK